MSDTAAPSAKRFAALALASVGVVYGDIGTSPLYAFKESISHLRGPDGLAIGDVLGVVSLALWTLMAIVTAKYVLLLMRFDNRGEGGVLSLMALVTKVGGRGKLAIAAVGMVGAGLFLGDAMLTPAVSVLSAVEGLKLIGGLEGRIEPFVVPIAFVVLVGLFAVQSRGTGKLGRWFGPICGLWFVVIAVLGVSQIVQAPGVLAALNPLHAFGVLARHPLIAPAIVGAVFLTVTGAEALYADMGHFGRRPINATWLFFVFPCLILNYLGQGALVLRAPELASDPFFLMAPAWFRAPLVLLATAATVIASQAVISGAFSLTQQAVQLGLLPRLRFRPTSDQHEGQIHAPQVNWILACGVGALVLTFRSSSALASAYGVSVVGAMITSTILAVLATWRTRGRPLAMALLIFAPFLAIEGAFAAANLLKVAHGGYVPLLIAGVSIVIMVVWRTGSSALVAAEQRDVALKDVLDSLARRPPMRARGTAVFLTADPDAAPVALLHNLKHNQVLHEQVVILTVRTAARPHVPAAERACIETVAPDVKRLTLTFGFMEAPDVAAALPSARAQGLQLDLTRTSFFVSRRTLVPNAAHGLTGLRTALFLFLSRNALRAADYFRLPPARVVELGTQVVV